MLSLEVPVGATIVGGLENEILRDGNTSSGADDRGVACPTGGGVGLGACSVGADIFFTVFGFARGTVLERTLPAKAWAAAVTSSISLKSELGTADPTASAAAATAVAAAAALICPSSCM